MNKCFIITAFINGSIKDNINITQNDYIICADGGYKFATQEKITPNLLLGDFDSFKGPLPQEIQTITYPVEKDDTDTMLCVKYAVEKGFNDICLVGGMGGRLDHTISNLQSMSWAIEFWNANHLKGKKISMSDCQNHVMLIMDDSIIISGTPGEKISLLSYSENCMNVTTKNLKWELTNALLRNSFPLGISNEFLTSECEISVEKGQLLIIRAKD